MRRLVWLLVPLSLAGCGGGKAATTLSVSCDSGTELFGAVSITLSGDLADGRPTLTFPDPANPGKTGSIPVQPHGHCTITPSAPG